MAIDPDDIPGISAAIASGSTEAFATFYEGWVDHCHERVRMMTGFDEATSLDVEQEVMEGDMIDKVIYDATVWRAGNESMQ